MKELFVKYEIALRVKELGLVGIFFGVYYNKDGYVRRSSVDEVGDAPTYQQVTDWLREKHNIEIYCPNYYKNSKGYKPEYECRVNGKQLSNEYSSSSSVILFANYYDAMNKAIEEALKSIK